MATNGMRSISKGGAIIRRYTHGPWRTGVCGGCGQGGNRAAGQGKIPSLSVNLNLLMRLLLRRGTGMGQKLWLANWHIAQEHNLRRDRVTSWLSDDFWLEIQPVMTGQIVFLVPKCHPRSCYAAPPTVQVWILSIAEGVRRWEMDLLPPPREARLRIAGEWRGRGTFNCLEFHGWEILERSQQVYKML
uniref:Uncharacterized protein n=1 Tax=Oryza glumipatula TaxID=40148 RepID=A0A0E0AU56_9ORYZ